MHRHSRHLLPLVLVIVAIAACGGSAASATPSASPSPSPEQSAAPPSAEPSPAGNGQEPGVVPDSERVDPQPGQQAVQSIPLERLEATVDGRNVTLTAHWSSGVAPCSVLDQVLINVSEHVVDVTIREGTSDPNAACVLMLQAKHTVVTFELEPGSYSIRDTEGGAQSIEVTVS